MNNENDKPVVPASPNREAKVERLLRRMLEGMGAGIDRRLGRETIATPGAGNFTTGTLIQRMKRLIDERTVDRGREGRFAPHLLNLKIEWGTHSDAPPEKIKELEHEILAAAIDHINDNRYRTFAPVKLETTVDIFTTGVAVDPTFGEFAETLSAASNSPNKQSGQTSQRQPVPAAQEVRVAARINSPDGTSEKILSFIPGGKRLGVGRASDANISLPHPSVSKIHAALMMNREGTLLVADTGSTNGTYINGRRIAYGEARQIEDGDVVSFGEIEVRLRKVQEPL